MANPERIPDELWPALSDFRHAIRRFLEFSAGAARREGITPQQHQILLAVRAAASPGGATIGYLAMRLAIRHHSAVGLVDRMARRGWVRRERDPSDRRRVIVALTSLGEAKLLRFTKAMLREYRTEGPALVLALQRVMRTVKRQPRR